MRRAIVGIDFRHSLLTAYVKVAGRTTESTEREAKRIAHTIREELPHARVQNPRYIGFDQKLGTLIFEIPVILGAIDSSTKAYLAKLQLKGAPSG